MTCPSCGTKRYMEFECVSCCVRWLRNMPKDHVATNAPMIERIAGKEHMNKVREEWKKRNLTKGGK